MTAPPPGGPGDRRDSVGLIADAPKNEGKTLFSGSVTLRVAEARVDDVGRALARLAPADLVRIGARPGDVLQIAGRMLAVARADLQPPDGAGTVQIDGTVRGNCGAGLQEFVTLTRVEHAAAMSVRLAPLRGPGPAAVSVERMRDDLVGVPVVTGAIVRAPTFAKAVTFQVARTIPSGPVVIDRRTDLRVVDADQAAAPAPGVSYEDVGGLERELARVREIVELPLKNARIFERLGILPPKGVLLYGPPGTGKTLLARAVAAESRVHFIHLNGAEIVRKLYGESEAKLRDVFEDAARHAPAIIFIDEIDAVAPKRAEVVGEVEKRVVAQLLGLMDGFVARGQVVVIGATNIPEVLDPALRRPGRFDREIEIGVPNSAGRLQILKIHTRAMPLASDVRLEEIAEHTHGFVGADLEALCQEVGMIALRRFLSKAASPADDMTAAQLDALQVTADDVLQGLRLVEPSATREFLIERPSVGFTSIGGLGDVKRLLRAIVTRARGHDELYEQTGLTPPRGILFTGPSGTGKTATARALAGETALPLIAVDGPRLFSKWLGESERAVRDVFKKARRAAPCLLFFDNIDALAPRLIDEGTDQPTGGVYPRVISQLLQEIDGVGDIDGVIVLAATSRLERVDPAVLRSGRFDYVLRFDLPDEPAREEIARIGCRQAPLDADVDLAELARRTAGHTGADIVSACKKAILVAIERYRRPDRPHDERFAIRRQDFEENLPS